MYKLTINLVSTLSMFLGMTAQAASFDCSKASSASEKTICNNPSISALDDKLAEAYKVARAKTSDEAKLKSEQVAWIKESRSCGSDLICLEKSYKSRISELNGAVVTNSQLTPPKDGFKDESERRFMNKHGFDTIQAYNDYIKATPEDKIKISASNFASKKSADYVIECSSSVQAFNNYLNFHKPTKETEYAKKVDANMWDAVLIELIAQKKVDGKNATQRLTDAFMAKGNKLTANHNKDIAYFNQLSIQAQKCREDILPYFAAGTISEYKR